MPLSNIDYGSGQDSMQDVFDKVNLAIDEINNNLVIKWKIIEIGDWDMTSEPSVLLAHGVLDFTKIRSVSVMVRNDSGTQIFPLTPANKAVNNFSIGPEIIGIGLESGANMFETTDFDSTSYNRGWVTIGYVE